MRCMVTGRGAAPHAYLYTTVPHGPLLFEPLGSAPHFVSQQVHRRAENIAELVMMVWIIHSNDIQLRTTNTRNDARSGLFARARSQRRYVEHLSRCGKHLHTGAQGAVSKMRRDTKEVGRHRKCAVESSRAGDVRCGRMTKGGEICTAHLAISERRSTISCP